MNFDYCRIGSTNSSTTSVTLHELATNIATDWVPRTPNSLSRGFVDLLSNILETRTLNRQNLLVLKPKVRNFEKQWKQVTSWILGVAFCRKIVELEGYPWWAPVSAFSSGDARLRPSAANWYPLLPRSRCIISKPNPSTSNLMPDYVLARIHPSNGLEISFAESKGTKDYLANMSSAPQSWVNQSKNAELFYRGNLINPTQQIVVATRVNPNAKLDATRRVYVRAWNSRNDGNTAPTDAILDIMLMHYFGVCKRIGMDATANLLALSTYLSSGQFRRQTTEKHIKIVNNSIDKLSKMAKEEVTHGEIRQRKDMPIFYASPRSEFILGDMRILIGLSEPAMRMIKHLQGGIEDSLNYDFMTYFQEEIESLKSLIKESPEIVIHNDGVITELL